MPILIEKLKNAVKRNQEVIDIAITSDLTEDRLQNVLKARRMAAEDCIYFMKEIDRLEGELHGEEVKSTKSKSFPKQMASQIRKA